MENWCLKLVAQEMILNSIWIFSPGQNHNCLDRHPFRLENIQCQTIISSTVVYILITIYNQTKRYCCVDCYPNIYCWFCIVNNPWVCTVIYTAWAQIQSELYACVLYQSPPLLKNIKMFITWNNISFTNMLDCWAWAYSKSCENHRHVHIVM